MSDKVHLLGDYNQQQYEYPEQDINYQGRHLDTQLKSGPLQSRGCRDILFVVLYLGLWAVMVYCSIIAYKKGDISYIYSPFDMFNNQCGMNDAKDYPNLYMQNPKTFYCVKSCPYKEGQTLNAYKANNVVSAYESKRIVTLCFPLVNDSIDYLGDVINLGEFQKNYADLEETWPIILACAGIALTISILLTFLIRFTAGCIVWGMIILYLIVVSGIGLVAYMQIDGEFEEYKYIEDKTTLSIIAYTCWGIAGFSLLIILCLTKKIHQAIKILKTAATFVRETWTAMFVPIVTLLLILLFFSFWLIFSALIYSTSGDFNRSDFHPYMEMKWTANTGWQLVMFFFALIWNVAFSIALCQFVIASACCMWYFSHIGYETSNSVIKGFCRAFTTSFGSLLFGSLVLAFVWILQLILEVVHKNLKNSVAGNNQAIGCLMKCCKYCVAYFEKFIRYLNQNAYTMIALTGQGFCDAAYDAFYVITRNMVRVALTHGLGQVFEFISTLFITATSTLCCYLIITKTDYNEKIQSTMAPTLAFVLVGYVIGRMFMNIYGMGVDTLLLCYIVDYEVNRSEGGPKSVPNTFKEYVSEYE